jgi:hypothetical protein
LWSLVLIELLRTRARRESSALALELLELRRMVLRDGVSILAPGRVGSSNLRLACTTISDAQGPERAISARAVGRLPLAILSLARGKPRASS